MQAVLSRTTQCAWQHCVCDVAGTFTKYYNYSILCITGVEIQCRMNTVQKLVSTCLLYRCVKVIFSPLCIQYMQHCQPEALWLGQFMCDLHVCVAKNLLLSQKGYSVTMSCRSGCYNMPILRRSGDWLWANMQLIVLKSKPNTDEDGRTEYQLIFFSPLHCALTKITLYHTHTELKGWNWKDLNLDYIFKIWKWTIQSCTSCVNVLFGDSREK